MEILARGVGRRKEAVAQVQIVKGTGEFLINNLPAHQYLHNNTCSLLSVKGPFSVLHTNVGTNETAEPSGSSDLVTPNAESNLSNTTTNDVSPKVTSAANFNFETLDTIVKVKGGGLVGQAEAIKLGLARAICELSTGSTEKSETITVQVSDEIRKQLKDKGYLTQDSRVKERRKYGLKKARKASQYHKR
uniref:Small ribosomal subunit protein uS9c n=1 Tax=Chlamydomonas applanata TaxID=35704 RepID=A0A0S2LPC6_CHLAP|nr:ribosomal protein S9 [Chlamydomonas applanata]